MKAIRELEPGVLATFRLFIGVQLLIAILGMATHLIPPFDSPSEILRHFRVVTSSVGVITQLTLIALESLPLFLFLSSRSLPRLLRSYYLPIGIIWAVTWPIFAPYIELHTARNSTPELLLQSALWQQTILLFIPLIVVSWQYSLREVFVFCILTVTLNSVLLLTSKDFIGIPLFRALFGIVFIQVVAFLLVGHMVANLVKVQREQRQSLTEANLRLAQHASTLEQLTISRERNRLARELHDTLAHSLSGVAVQLEALDTLLEDSSSEAKALLRQSLSTTRSGLNETRRALRALRAGPLEDLGLALTIRNLAESVASRSNLKLKLDIPDHLESLSPELEQGMYRVVQEALENVARHAEAKNLQVQLSQTNECLALTISDDGRGFDPKNVNQLDRFGIQGMQEWTEMLGGQFEVESQPERGTTIRFTWRRRT